MRPLPLERVFKPSETSSSPLGEDIQNLEAFWLSYAGAWCGQVWQDRPTHAQSWWQALSRDSDPVSSTPERRAISYTRISSILWA